jgi:hypothetical protein
MAGISRNRARLPVVSMASAPLPRRIVRAIAPGEQPVGLGIDLAKRRLFVSCRNDKMLVLEADTGKARGSLPIGKGTDACIFDASVNLAFSSNKDGTLTVIDASVAGPYRVLENVPTEEGAKTMALGQPLGELLWHAGGAPRRVNARSPRTKTRSWAPRPARSPPLVWARRVALCILNRWVAPRILRLEAERLTAFATGK